MTLDGKWLELLKASGWQTGCLALACIAFLLLSRFGAISPDPWMTIVAVALLLGFLALALASLGQAAFGPIKAWVQARLAIRKAQRKIADYIPFMTDKRTADYWLFVEASAQVVRLR